MAEAKLIAIPDGVVVERLAVAMAAANGYALRAVDDATRDSYRRAANGALIYLSLAEPNPAHLAGVMEGISDALRRAAEALDFHDAREETIRDLHRRAGQAELVSTMLGLNAEGPEEVV